MKGSTRATLMAAILMAAAASGMPAIEQTWRDERRAPRRRNQRQRRKQRRRGVAK